MWAPKRRRVAVESGATLVDLETEEGGWFSGLLRAARPGDPYAFRLDDADRSLPDPASRFQPRGPHGPSQVVDPGAFRWTDEGWPGVSLEGQVLYEMHVGTFTPEGTWAAAAEERAGLVELGVTAVEVMPVAEFGGRHGWGYDGVDLFAPTATYGTPDDFRRFVDRAHACGLAVLLDVVYNHFGPDGNYLREFADEYFSARRTTDWGDAIDFEGPRSGPVREFFVANAVHWISEYHLDGLRLDATQNVYDDGPRHILVEIGEAARRAAGGRGILLVAENESQDARFVRDPERGGYGFDAIWNDDFHHEAVVAVTGRAEAYYTDYLGSAQEFVSLAKHGTLFQGQRYEWQRKRRGSPALDVGPASFVAYLENHDQVANSGRGRRIPQVTSPGRHRAMTALLLLGPWTPMLFQGQEFAASSPFLYFADHAGELGESVRRGRAEFLRQFASLASAAASLADPCDPTTYRISTLDPSERRLQGPAVSLHRDLLALRRTTGAFRRQARGGLDGAVLAAEAFVLRFFDPEEGDRLLLVNLGRDLRLVPAPESLLAPPARATWRTAWSSEDPAYGGGGTAPVETDEGWRVPGHAAVVLSPLPGGDLR